MMRKSDTLKNKARWLEEYAKEGIISVACRATGIGRSTIYDWEREDAEFADAMAQALEESTEALEQVVMQRAKGKSDLLAMFILKARKPEVYREKYEVTGENAGPIRVEFYRAEE